MDIKQMDEPTSDHPKENDQQLEENTVKEQFTVFRSVQSIIAVAVLIATFFTLWNPRNILRTPNIYDLFQSESIIDSVQSNFSADHSDIRIGLLAGHWQNSTGEVCADGTIEVDINQEIAQRLKYSLEENNIQVNLFPEFDLDLLNYEADALIAIYSGSCAANPAPPSGFKIGTSLTAENQEQVNDLAVCLAEKYQSYTRLPFSYEVINPDHASYHIFRDISNSTPAVIIEIGSLSTDRDIITNQSNIVVEGLVSGIACFVENKSGVE